MRMRRRAAAFLLLIAALAASVTTRAQTGKDLKVIPQGELDIVKVLVAQERDWNDGNLDGFLTGYKHSPQTTFLSGSIQHGSDEMAAHYRTSYPNKDAMGNLSFSDLEPRILDEHYALITGRYHLERAKRFGGNAGGIFSLVFEKTDAGWKIILDHTS